MTALTHNRLFRSAMAIAAGLMSAGCGGERAAPAHVPFDSLFARERVIALEPSSGVIGAASAILRWSEHWVILDRLEGNVKVFDDEGHGVRTIGRIGWGPEEFQQPVAGAVLPSGQLAVLDQVRSQLSFYSWPDVWDTTWTLDGLAPRAVVPAGDSLIVSYVRVSQSTTEIDPHTLHVFDHQGVHVGSSWVPDTGPGPYGGTFIRTSVTTVGRRVVAGIMTSNRIDWFEPGAKTADSIRVGAAVYETPAWETDPNPLDAGGVAEWAMEQMWLTDIIGLDDSLAIARFTRFRDGDDGERSNYVVFDLERGDLAYTNKTGRQLVSADRGRLLAVEILEPGGAVLEIWRLNRAVLGRRES